MRFEDCTKPYGLALWAAMLVCSPALLLAQPGSVTSHVTIWDTVTPLAKLDDRDRWQAVPTDLLTLESNPTAAMSDPSFYGRAYSFEGDAVVETAHLLAAFPKDRQNIVMISKTDPTGQVKVAPLPSGGTPARITRCSILRNTGHEAALKVSFSTGSGTGHDHVIFSLGPAGIVAIKPAAPVTGVSIQGQMAYGIVPGFVGDDLIFGPEQYPAVDRLRIPSDNLFLGLLEGRSSMLVVTWPKGRQKVTLSMDAESRAQGLLEAVDLENDGKTVYVALLEAPGLWHREVLKRTYLEKDITLDWKRPFGAKWKTQLLEGKTRTTFVFQEAKQKIWRGAVGSYTYPVWFDNDAAVYRLSKKIPPRGESIVYFTERQATPLSVLAPVDIVKAALGRDLYDDILDVSGRQLRTHHRRGAQGIRRACTCGCTDAIEAVFKAGQAQDRRQYVEEAVEDMVYFVTRHVQRIEEYQTFARDMITFLALTRQSAGNAGTFVDHMKAITEELQTEYTRAKANMKTLAFADQLAQETNALTRKKGPDNLEACLELCKQWRAMGGAQDDVLAQSHRIVRKLHQEAGYQGVTTPRAAEIASQIRAKCTQCLRNPDGYEIWGNY